MTYIKREEKFIKDLTIEKELALANKYIDPARMYYVVVGDAKTQLDDLEKVGIRKTDSGKIEMSDETQIHVTAKITKLYHKVRKGILYYFDFVCFASSLCALRLNCFY